MLLDDHDWTLQFAWCFACIGWPVMEYGYIDCGQVGLGKLPSCVDLKYLERSIYMQLANKSPHVAINCVKQQ